MPVKNWSDGDYVYGSDLDLLSSSVVMRFANTTARGNTLVGDLAPVPGMVVYMTDTSRLYVYQTGGYWLPMPGSVVAILRQRVGQAIPTPSTSYPLAFETEDLDVLNAHSTSTFNSRFTCTLPGYYEFTGGSSFTSDATGYRMNSFTKGGSPIFGSASTCAPITGLATCLTARPTVVLLALNEYVELQVVHTSGASSYTTYGGAGVDASYNSTMTVKYLGQ